jgi:SAM-dependent methyltransferase
MLVFWIVLLVFVVVSAVTSAMASLRAAPYLPTLNRDVERLLDLAGIRDGDLVYDLGSGDGRVLTAALRRGPRVRVIGYELGLFFYLVSVLRIRLARAGKRASVRWQDFYRPSLAAANVVVCFLTPEAMAKLEPKFRAELRPGTRIVSAVFPMPTWPLDAKEKTKGRVSVYRYVVPPGKPVESGV